MGLSTPGQNHKTMSTCSSSVLWLIVSTPEDTKFRHIPTFSPKKRVPKNSPQCWPYLTLKTTHIFSNFHTPADRTGARPFLLIYPNETPEFAFSALQHANRLTLPSSLVPATSNCSSNSGRRVLSIQVIEDCKTRRFDSAGGVQCWKRDWGGGAIYH